MSQIKAPIVTVSMPRLAEGFADGTITVTVDPTDLTADTVFVYWADADRQRLAGYNFLTRKRSDGFSAVFEKKEKISTSYEPTGKPTVLTVPHNRVVPEGAAGLLIEAGAAEPVFVPLPTAPGKVKLGRKLMEFQVASDLHLERGREDPSFLHTAALFEDIAETSPDSAGLMIAGDIMQHSRPYEYDLMNQLVAEARGIPEITAVVGNHDLTGFRLEETEIPAYHSYFGDDPQYFDRWIGGYHFIFLALRPRDTVIPMEEEEVAWLREKLAEDADPSKPIFLFCHEGFKDTVAGCGEDEGWWGISDDGEARSLLTAYPQAILFTGHTHWECASLNQIYYADERMCNGVNTASVSYLWTGLDRAKGEWLDGSEALYVEVYENGSVLIRCRDILRRTWVAEYVIFMPANKN